MTMVSPDDGRPSISRTARYKKVTKPLLERKRRARINRCLDELKDLMVGAFEVEGDNISKLEKADILELTVRHLTKIHSPRDPIADAKRFQAGFGQCAAEACQFILSTPGVDSQIGQNLVKHLSTQIADVPLSVQVPNRSTFSPPVSPQARSLWSSPRNREYIQNIRDGNQISPSSEAPLPLQNRQASPHVPINQSLICDTASMNSTPSIQDLSKPMTGLLMTVDKNQYINPYDYAYRNHPSMSEDDKKRHDAEMKHVIMKKIREQILGRQTKEMESKSVVSSTSYESHQLDRPNTSQNDYRYQNYARDGQISNSSIDLRKKSKGESKHYSPYIESRPQSIDVDKYEASSSSKALNYSTNALSDIYPSNETKRNYDALSDSESYAVRKRHADYRSIHPKKVLIRPIVECEDKKVIGSFNKEHSKVRVNELRYQRPSNIGRNQEHDRMNREQSNFSSHSGYNVDMSNGRYRYDDSRNEPRDDQELLNNDNDSEDNMWRPW